MEGSFLQATRRRRAGDTVRTPSSKFFIEPPILGLLFLMLDIGLFAVPGLLIANQTGFLAAGNGATLEVGLTLCLAIAFFFAATRAFDIHDGLKIMRRSMPAQLALSLICVAGPVIALLLICRILTGGTPE